MVVGSNPTGPTLNLRALGRGLKMEIRELFRLFGDKGCWATDAAPSDILSPAWNSD